MPQRLHRTRKAKAFTPAGAIYVGRPTLWANPFAQRQRIGHKRSIILYRAWINGDLTSYVLQCAGFSTAEIATLNRWRERLVAQLHRLRDRDLQCWCPLTSAWCHADALLRTANDQVPVQ